MSKCDCESMDGRFGAHRDECPASDVSEDLEDLEDQTRTDEMKRRIENVINWGYRDGRDPFIVIDQIFRILKDY